MSNRGGLLTLKEAAQQVGISKQGLWLWVGRGLDAKQYGKYWFVTPRALERWKQRTGRSSSLAPDALKRRKHYAHLGVPDSTKQ